MKKHVKSSDPRKPAIVAALKRVTGATRVTLVTEIAPGTFRANCMQPSPTRRRSYVDLGYFIVETKPGNSIAKVTRECELPATCHCPPCKLAHTMLARGPANHWTATLVGRALALQPVR